MSRMAPPSSQDTNTPRWEESLGTAEDLEHDFGPRKQLIASPVKPTPSTGVTSPSSQPKTT
jgi:hypothetical protein